VLLPFSPAVAPSFFVLRERFDACAELSLAVVLVSLA